jgi:hypothetical protein
MHIYNFTYISRIVSFICKIRQKWFHRIDSVLFLIQFFASRKGEEQGMIHTYAHTYICTHIHMHVVRKQRSVLSDVYEASYKA